MRMNRKQLRERCGSRVNELVRNSSQWRKKKSKNIKWKLYHNNGKEPSKRSPKVKIDLRESRVRHLDYRDRKWREHLRWCTAFPRTKWLRWTTLRSPICSKWGALGPSPAASTREEAPSRRLTSLPIRTLKALPTSWKTTRTSPSPRLSRTPKPNHFYS